MVTADPGVDAGIAAGPSRAKVRSRRPTRMLRSPWKVWPVSMDGGQRPESQLHPSMINH